mgnify:CR=1 FL=1
MLTNLTRKTAKFANTLISEIDYKVAKFKHSFFLPLINESDRSIVTGLQQEGAFITSLDKLAISATPALLQALKKLLAAIPITSHNFTSYFTKSSVEFRSNQLIKDYPEIFLWGLDNRLLDIIENFMQLPVAYHGVDPRRYVPALDRAEQIGTLLWHIDLEDRCILKIIIYLNDVSINEAPFEYIPISYMPRWPLLRYIRRKIFRQDPVCFSDSELKKFIPESAWKPCLGSAGTVIFANTNRIFHRVKVNQSDRLSLCFVYSSRKPKNSQLCRTSFNYDRNLISSITQKLSGQQQECIKSVISGFDSRDFW